MFKITKSSENTRLFNIMLDNYKDYIFDLKFTKDCIFFSVIDDDISQIISKDEGSKEMANFINIIETVESNIIPLW